MSNSIMQYVRKRSGKIHGILIAVPRGANRYAIGYSMCNLALDKFNRNEGMRLAHERAMELQISPFIQDLPIGVKHDYIKFEGRARRYFRDRLPL